MALVVIVHPILRIIFDKVYVALVPSNTASDSAKVEERGKIRASYDICFAAIFLFVLHGFSAFKVLLLLGMNFSIAKGLPRPWIPAATWIFNIGILFANELCHGYSYRSIAEFIIPAPFDAAEIGWGSWLDSYGGLIPRWEILFNITVLRLISFNLDYYWALDSRSASSQVEVRVIDCPPSQQRILTAQRRNSLTRPSYLKEIASRYQQRSTDTIFSTIRPMYYTRLSILQGPF